MIAAWRMSRRKYWPTAFNGEGSRKEGGRWNSGGVPAVYLADTFALAQLETLVNVPHRRLASLYLGIARVEFTEHLIYRLPDTYLVDIHSLLREFSDR